MNLLLLIGKIVLILILIVLVAALLVLLLVLLVPIRYEMNFSIDDPEGMQPASEGTDGNGENGENSALIAQFDRLASKTDADLKFSWLIRLVQGELAWPGGSGLTVKIFGKKLDLSEKFGEDSDQEAPDNEAQRELDRMRAEREGRDGKTEGPAEDAELLDGSPASEGASEKESSALETDSLRKENSSGKEGSSVKEKAGHWLWNKIETIEESVQAFRDTAVSALNRISDIHGFMARETTRKALRRLLQVVAKLLKRYLPAEWHVNGTVGLGDPAYTGKMLEVIGISLPYTADHISITPEFSMVRCDVKGHARGKVRLIFIVFALVRAVLDRNVRSCWRQRQDLLSALN